MFGKQVLKPEQLLFEKKENNIFYSNKTHLILQCINCVHTKLKLKLSKKLSLLKYNSDTSCRKDEHVYEQLSKIPLAYDKNMIHDTNQ